MLKDLALAWGREGKEVGGGMSGKACACGGGAWIEYDGACSDVSLKQHQHQQQLAVAPPSAHAWPAAHCLQASHTRMPAALLASCRISIVCFPCLCIGAVLVDDGSSLLGSSSSCRCCQQDSLGSMPMVASVLSP